jgi:tetratricopeptide (TPR) repeat protein
VSDLGDALFLFCASNGTDAARAHWSFDLLREAVLLRPPSHPLRDRSLHNLARALYVVKYIQQSGNLAVLTECIQLGREALQLRPAGHPEHAHTLGNLALALMSFFERCGDPAVLLECISMKREVLQLLKPGHPRRDFPLNNLAIALRQFAWSYGSVEALAETEGLFREVLALRPPGHPLRFQVLDNLAGSLRMRFDLQNLPTALVEAIMLMRQAWEIQPASHPDHWKLMSNLAQCLIVDFRHRHDSSSITEAIMLLRRLLVLKPPGSYASVFVLNSLAEALLARFDEYGDFVDLLEAITLQREALTMSPPGSIQRPKALQCLGRLLCKPRCRSWHEALALFQEALVSCPAGHSSRPSLSSDLSICFLDPESPLFDITKGIAHLSESYSNELSHVNQRLGQAVLDLRRLETAFTVFARDVDELTTNLYSSQILELYAQAIRLLPHAANFGLDHKTRLQVIASSDEIARNAAARALLLGHTSQAVELLEEGRGVFWSQTLHLRATGFENVPDSDRENLVRLLRMLEHGTRTSDNSGQTVAQREEALERRRRLNEEAQTLISRIRTYPGCTRFLMPSAFASLYSGLPDGFVVIINASKLSHHALLLHKVTGLATSLKLQSPSTCLNWTNLRARLPRDVDAQSEQEYKSTSRAMRLDNTRADSLEQVLSQLWTGMVQSILRMLGLEVRENLAAR